MKGQLYLKVAFFRAAFFCSLVNEQSEFTSGTIPPKSRFNRGEGGYFLRNGVKNMAESKPAKQIKDEKRKAEQRAQAEQLKKELAEGAREKTAQPAQQASQPKDQGGFSWFFN